MNHLDSASVLLIAIIIDLVLGEPPAKIHPVVWTGKAIDLLKQMAPAGGRKMFGAAIAIFLIVLVALAGYLVVELLLSVNRWLGIFFAAFLLKSTFAFKSLVHAAGGVAEKLEEGNLKGARERLHWLCSRDPSELSEAQIASAAIESASENFVDTILSPLLYFTVFSLFGIGIFAVLAFKVASTLDSMIGYKTEPYKDLGFFAAKLDDMLNFPAARLSIPLLSVASITTGSPLMAITIAFRDGSKTLSPNSGHPMASAAGALEIRLEKTGSGESYLLGHEFRQPLPEDIRRAIKILKLASIASFVISLIVTYGVGSML